VGARFELMRPKGVVIRLAGLQPSGDIAFNKNR
jgi:hypothetical protein